MQDQFQWKRSATQYDRIVGRMSFFGDEILFESGHGVAGLRWHQFLILGRDNERLSSKDLDSVDQKLPRKMTFERKVVNESDPLFNRRPDDVGPWKVFHWESRSTLSTTGTLMGGPETHIYRVVAAPYWLLMAPCFLPVAWWLACPSGRFLPSLTLKRLAGLIVVMALGCWALAAFSRSSASDRALSVVAEMGGSFLPGKGDLYINYDDESGGMDDAKAARLRAALAMLPKLKSVTSFSKTLVGSRYAFLVDQPDIEDVQLSRAREEDVILSFLQDARKLRFLSVDGTGMTDAGLVHLKGLVSLEALIIRGQPITDAGLAHLEGLPRLRMVELDSKQPGAAPKSRITPEAVRRLFKATPSLSQVDLPDGRRMSRED